MDGSSLNRRGFTLIELLLAVGLSALMVGVVMGTFVAIRKGVNEGLVRHDAESEGVLITKRVMLDLESAYLGNPMLPDRFYFEGKVSGALWQTGRLSFVSTSAGEVEKLKGISDLERVIYRLLPSGKREGYYNLYRDVAPLGSRVRVRKEMISDRIASFRVVYEDRNSRFSRRWDSRADQWANRLPRLIRIELVLWDAQGKRHTFRAEAHPMQDWMD